jgi:hypothetical protein
VHGSEYALRMIVIFVGAVVLSWSQANPSLLGSRGDVLIDDENLPPAHLIFASDSHTSELKALFTPELMDELHQINAGVALSTGDFSSERAQIVRRLNEAGIATVAWIVLDQRDGYYVNAENAAATARRFAEFDRWTTENGLRWEAVGLDIEPLLRDWDVMNHQRLRFLLMILRRLFVSNGQVYRTREFYVDLIRGMQSRGYYVQTYQLPLIVNERKAHSTVLERILGLVDVRGDQEVLMLYTSFNPALGAAMIYQYGPYTQAIAVGSTAGTPDAVPSGKFSPLNWDEFSRDLIVARHFSPIVGVYSLEGCVSNGYISRLKAMNWNRSLLIPAASIKKAARIQKVIYHMLWMARLTPYLIGLVLLFSAWLFRVMLHRLKKQRALKGQQAS